MSVPITAGPPRRALLATRRDNEGCAQIPAGVRFEGTAQFGCDVLVEGALAGDVCLTGESLLHVSSRGSAEGTLACPAARIEGTLTGDLDCAGGPVTITSSAYCRVRIHYGELSVERGADVEADFFQSGTHHG